MLAWVVGQGWGRRTRGGGGGQGLGTSVPGRAGRNKGWVGLSARVARARDALSGWPGVVRGGLVGRVGWMRTGLGSRGGPDMGGEGSVGQERNGRPCPGWSDLGRGRFGLVRVVGADGARVVGVGPNRQAGRPGRAWIVGLGLDRRAGLVSSSRDGLVWFVRPGEDWKVGQGRAG